jgi:hypothetical protein
MRLRVVLVGALLAVSASVWGQAVNVRDCGAVGDGKADDTAAFEQAIRQAAERGLSAFVPRGTYRLTRPLVMKAVALTGPEGAAWNGDLDTMPILAPEHRNGPCVQLDASAGLRGVAIRYDWSKEPEEGPPAVLVTGVGAYVSNVKIMYPWDGILTDGVNNVGRLNVENVFIVSPRNIGVRVTGTWDVPAIRNVEVWNLGPVPRPLAKGIGFDLGKNDLVRLSDCFVFAMHTGYRLRDKIPGCTIEGGTWGTMASCASDYCSIGVDVEGDHTLSIAGGTFWNHHVGLRVAGKGGRVRLSGAEIKSNAAPAVEVLGGDHVVISGCSLLRFMKEFSHPAVRLVGGRTTLTGCHVESVTDGILIEQGVRSAILQGNTIAAESGKDLTDKREGGDKAAPPKTP